MNNNSDKEIDNLIVSAQSSKEQGDLSSTLNYLNKILKLDTNNKRNLKKILMKKSSII